MGLRSRTQQPFWRITPIRSTEPSALYQHGIECVGKRDGKGMIATGWALCQVSGLHQHQASDFLTDGYRIWRDSPGFDRAQAAAFLSDLFGALSSLTPPAVPADIWSASPEVVMPASIYYGTRCWAGNELLEVATDPQTKAQYEPLVFRSAAEAPHDFVPTRSVEFAKDYAARHGLPEPWVIVLPGQREVVPAGTTSAGRGGAAPTEVSNFAGSGGPAAPPTPGPGVGPGSNGSSPAGWGSDDAAARDRQQRERAEQQRLEQERQAEQERHQREQWERAQREQAQREQAQREQAQREQAERAERERVERERAEQERQRAEQERLQREQWERAQREQAERAQREQAERDRVQREAWERAQREQAERERQERERQERERAEQERQREQAERERIQREAWERAQREQAERDRIQREAWERAQREQAERAERERQERERAEQERLQREAWERQQAERAEQERQRAERERQERDRADQERQRAARPRPRPRPTPNPTGATSAPSPRPTPQTGLPRPSDAPPSWAAPAAGAQLAQLDGRSSASPLDVNQQTVEFVRPVQPFQAAPDAQQQDPAPVSPRLEDLRSKVMTWLSAAYRDVRLEANGWITVPDIGPSVIQVETSIVQGGHRKVEVFAPLVIDVPLTPELYRYVALEGGRFHFGAITLDAGEDGTEQQGLLQFSHSVLADTLQHDDLLAVVWLVAATIVTRAPELQQRFGGLLFAELER